MFVGVDIPKVHHFGGTMAELGARKSWRDSRRSWGSGNWASRLACATSIPAWSSQGDVDPGRHETRPRPQRDRAEMRGQIRAQEREIGILKRAGIPTASAELLAALLGID